MNRKLQLFSSAALMGLLSFSGCGDDDSDETADTEATTTDANSETTAGEETATAGGTGEATETGDETEETASEPPDDSTGASSEGNAGDPPAPDGQSCDENEGCESGVCFEITLLGGVCGECVTEDDCPNGGCTVPIPEPLANPGIGSTCNEGQAGGGCDTDAGCADGLMCAVIVEIPTIITAATCGDCVVDSDCDKGQVCAPEYDLENIGGTKRCVEAASVAVGGGCDLASKAAQCEDDAFCAPADILSFGELGVCSVCDADNGCTEGQSCVLPSVDIGPPLSITPAECR